MAQEVRTRTIFEDAGHSWLMVSKAELVELGIQSEISPFPTKKTASPFLRRIVILGFTKRL